MSILTILVLSNGYCTKRVIGRAASADRNRAPAGAILERLRMVLNIVKISNI